MMYQLEPDRVFADLAVSGKASKLLPTIFADSDDLSADEFADKYAPFIAEHYVHVLAYRMDLHVARQMAFDLWGYIHYMQKWAELDLPHQKRAVLHRAPERQSPLPDVERRAGERRVSNRSVPTERRMRQRRMSFSSDWASAGV